MRRAILGFDLLISPIYIKVKTVHITGSKGFEKFLKTIYQFRCVPSTKAITAQRLSGRGYGENNKRQCSKMPANSKQRIAEPVSLNRMLVAEFTISMTWI